MTTMEAQAILTIFAGIAVLAAMILVHYASEWAARRYKLDAWAERTGERLAAWARRKLGPGPGDDDDQ